ncbi:MAG: hypothetical protein IPK74_13125 [Deltaproteobacteria bacterium]|nr:hypothetical protein [Deltaproteobacteria bacterium]
MSIGLALAAAVASVPVGVAPTSVAAGEPAAALTTTPAPGGVAEPPAATALPAATPAPDSAAAPEVPATVAPVAVESPPATAAPAPSSPGPTPDAVPASADATPSTGEAPAEPPEAVGSDEPPLPPAPPRATGRIRSGGYTGVGWFALRFALEGGLLPAGRRTLSAGIGFEGGWRPHRVFGVLTRFASWGSTVEQRVVQDDAGDPIAVRDAGILNGWDVLGMRLFVPLRGRIEPSADVSSGFAVERRPFDPRRTWATVRIGAGVGVWLARTVTLRLEASWRLLARRSELRHYVGGTLGFSVHF